MAAAILILVLWLVAEIYLMVFLAKFIGGLGVFIILLIGVLAAIFYWKIKNRFSGVFSQAIQKTPLAEQMNVSAQREDGTKVSGELMEKNNAGKHSGKKKKRRRYGKK